MLKNIVFDFGNVVMKYDPDDYLNQYDLSSDDHQLLKSVIFDSKEWTDIDAGILTEDQATQIFIKKIPAKLVPKVQEIMQTWPEKSTLYTDVFDFMKELKQKGYHIYALSNIGMRFANYLMSTKYGAYFDGTIFSAEEKLVKPDPQIYQRLLNKYRLKPEECLFIDDIKANTDAAKKEGMDGFTFKIEKLPELKEYILK